MTDITTTRPGSVTQVVITYNMASLVTECLDSILQQTLDGFELLIFDDASPDGTADVIRRYLEAVGLDADILTPHTENVGLCATLNEALRSVSTDYVAFLSGDDVLEPRRLELQRDELDRRGDAVGLVYSDMYRMDAEGHRLPDTYLEHIAGYVAYRFKTDSEPVGPPVGDVFERLVWYHVIATPTTMMRTSVLRATGAYDEALDFEDWDMHLRLARRTEFAYLDVPLVSYRITPNSLWDQVSGRALEFNRQTRHLFAKHMDLTDHRGTLVATKIGELAKDSYLLGESPKSVRADLLLAGRSRRTVGDRVYMWFATLYIPGRFLKVAVDAVRSVKRFAGARVRRRHRPS